MILYQSTLLQFFVHLKSKTKGLVIPTDEGQSFAEILTIFQGKQLDLKAIMDWPVTSNPWAIVNEDLKSRSNQKSVFRNMLQQISPNPPSTFVPPSMHASVVDAMRIVRMIPISKLKPATYRSWVIKVLDNMTSLPGDILHIVFDNYEYPYDIPSKSRVAGVPRIVSNLDQQLPRENEWSDFLSNSRNKSKVIDLVVA